MSDIDLPARPLVHAQPGGLHLDIPENEFNWLGRLISRDLNDSSYRYATLKSADLLPEPSEPPRLERWWHEPVILPLDQGPRPRCVGFSIATAMICGPVTQPTIKKFIDGQNLADELYLQALTLDEWSGEDPNYGTSVRAGLKSAQAKGMVGTYTWMYSLNEAVDFVLKYGPLVMGTVWPDSMMRVDKDGYLRVAKDSTLYGPHAQGHAWCIDGVSKKRKRFRMVQTWGEWGIQEQGRAWVSFDDWETLFHNGGEAAGPMETKVQIHA